MKKAFSILFILTLFNGLAANKEDSIFWRDSLKKQIVRDSLERLALEVKNDNSIATARLEQKGLLAETERRALVAEEARQRKLTFAIVFLALTLMLVGVSIYIFRQGSAQRKASLWLAEEEQMRLEASILDEKATQEELEKQLFEKEWQANFEMQASFKDLLDRFNEEGKDLRDFLRRYQKSIPNQEGQLLRKIRLLLGQHSQRIQQSQTLQEEGLKLSEEVEAQLQKVFSGFKERDLKLMILILNDWTISAIADLYQVQAESINKRRYRLRKKLGITNGEDLKSFISNKLSEADA